MTTETAQPAGATAQESSQTAAPSSQNNAASEPAHDNTQQSQTDNAAQPDKSAQVDATKTEQKPGQDDFMFADNKKDGEADKADEKAKEGEDKEGEGKEAEPVTVETLTLPEEYSVPDTMKEAVNEAIKGNKFSKEQSQAIIDLGVKMRQQDIENWQKTKNAWRDEIVKDPELGGANAQKTKDNCNNVIRQFAGNEDNLKALQEDLILLGLGNKKSFVTFLNNVARATGNDRTDGNSGGKLPVGNSLDEKAKRMYPNMN